MTGERPADSPLGCAVAAVPLLFLLLWVLYRLWFVEYFPIP